VVNDEDLDELIGFVAAEANSEMNRRRRKQLDAAFATLNAALAGRSGFVTREPTLIRNSALIERPAPGLAGRWQILEMDLWDRDALDLVGPAIIEFAPDGAGSFGFIAVNGWMDCRWVEIHGRAGVEFSWEGADEGDQVSGRGRASLQDDGSLSGHIYFHLGDDSGFRATRPDEPEPRRRRRSSWP
jgi:hypothetical protein